MSLESTNNYTRMQQDYYDKEGMNGSMNVQNHSAHNNNPDYWSILVGDTDNKEYLDKVGLDFGCGCGRNILNILPRFKRMDGVDISKYLIRTTRSNLIDKGHLVDNFKLYLCNGIDLSTVPSDEYDFLMSTITLQHICVYAIRYNYLKEFYRVLKSGGLLSFQMGYGEGHPNTKEYEVDGYDASGTNSKCDVKVSSPDQIVKDLESIGFVDITYTIKGSYEDYHKEWIYVKARKP